MKQSRTLNSIKNSASSILAYVVTTLLAFAVRTAFVKCLDDAYLGVNGLFSNILTILSLAELGIGNAIIFKLYKPIANDDFATIKRLINFYKRCYTYIAIAVGVLGISLIPVLKYIVNLDTPIKGIYFIYLLYILDTVATYVYMHKISLVIAYQKERVSTFYTLYTNIVTSILQIIVLLVFKNFYLYLIVKIIVLLAFRYFLKCKIDVEYPFINTQPKETLTKSESQDIFKDVKALFGYKIGAALLNGSDNIIISAFIGTIQVGIYSNYYMIISAIKTIMVKFLHGCSASIGNLNAIGDIKSKRQVFFQMNYVTFFIFSFSAACLFALMEDFIKLWIGPNYLFDNKILIALIICFYVSGCHQIIMVFRDSMGLFRKGWFMPMITAVINIILSIVGAKICGVLGVFIATFVSSILTSTWYDPYLICKYRLYISPFSYYWRYIVYAFIACMNVFFTSRACLLIQVGGIIGFAIKCITALCCTVTINCITTFWLPEFRELLIRMKNMIIRK